MAKQKGKSRLSLALTLWLGVFLAGGGGIAYLFLPKRVESLISEEIGKKGIAICQQIARGAIDGLSVEDLEEKKLVLGRVVENVKKDNPDLISLVITDEGGKVWGSSEISEIEKIYVSPQGLSGMEVEFKQWVSPENQKMYEIAVPVVLKTRRIGTVYGEISLDRAREFSFLVGTWILVATGALFLLGCLGTMTIVSTLPTPEEIKEKPEVPKLKEGTLMMPEEEKQREEMLERRVDVLKEEELAILKRLEMHKKEEERLRELIQQTKEQGGLTVPPELREVAFKEESEIGKSIEAKRREEAILIARLENLKKAIAEAAVTPKPDHIILEEQEILKRIETKRKEEIQLTKRLESLKKVADGAKENIFEGLSQEEIDIVKRIEDKKKEEELLSQKIEEMKKAVESGATLPTAEIDKLKAEEAEIIQRIEIKKREEIALANKIDAIRKRIVDLDRRIEARRREELELAQRIEIRKGEATTLSKGGEKGEKSESSGT